MEGTAPSKVQVLLFAALREKVGTDRMDCEFTPGETVEQLAGRVIGSTRSIFFAVNDEFSPGGRVLNAGDTVAFIPPMAGG